MANRISTIAIVSLFIFSATALVAFAGSDAGLEKTKDRISKGVDNIFYGQVEIPDNLDQTKSKGTQLEKCNVKTRSGVERGIARVVGGVWQLATFWYSDPGCVTSSKQAAAGSSSDRTK